MTWENNVPAIQGMRSLSCDLQCAVSGHSAAQLFNVFTQGKRHKKAGFLGEPGFDYFSLQLPQSHANAIVLV